MQTALPHLVIIVDEFAELKAEQPDFMKELISAARIGRSLGVHLILATQKPSGVVDGQIWSNSKFKLCLKVQSKEDSNEVLKHRLQRRLKNPDGHICRLVNNEIFELFQSAFSGAPATLDESEGNKEFSVSELNFAGIKSGLPEKENKKEGFPYEEPAGGNCRLYSRILRRKRNQKTFEYLHAAIAGIINL